jgi:hypothetical protein
MWQSPQYMPVPEWNIALEERHLALARAVELERKPRRYGLGEPHAA